MDDSQRDELLVRMDERLKAISERLEKGDNRFDKLEKRVGTLENFKYTIVGAAMLGSAALTYFMEILKSKIWG